MSWWCDIINKVTWVDYVTYKEFSKNHHISFKEVSRVSCGRTSWSTSFIRSFQWQISFERLSSQHKYRGEIHIDKTLANWKRKHLNFLNLALAMSFLQVTSFFARAHLEVVDFQARWGLRGSQEWKGPKVSSIDGICSVRSGRSHHHYYHWFCPAETMIPNSRCSGMASFPKELVKSIHLSVNQLSI